MVVWIEGKSEERGGWGRGGGGKKERKENKNKKIIALIQVTQYLTKNSSREKKENEGDKIFKELM